MKYLTLIPLIAVACLAVNAQERSDFVPAESFIVPEGLEVKVWATTPLLQNPTNMDVDHLGRIWVAQGVNYRMFRNEGVLPRDPKGDKIVVLTDTDADGEADESHVFVQEPELIAPLGIAVIDNRIVVSQPPSIIVYTDVDRNAMFDPKTDTREIFLTGFGGKDHDHSLHSVTTGPNGQWYFNTGNAGTHIVTDKEGWTLRVGSVYKGGAPSVTDPGPNQGGQPDLKSDDGHVYVGSVALRVNPDGTGLRPIGHNMRNSYEETVSSFGDVFQNDNDDPPACRTTWLMEYGNLGFASDDGARKWQTERRPGQPAAIAEWRQEDPGTIPAGDVYGNGSPTGIAFYENGALGEEYRGLLLSCEAARNVVFGYLPKPQGAGFVLERFDFMRSKRADEFPEGQEGNADLANLFRPSDIAVGPDGSIYVADWFDSGVGGHRMTDPKAAGTIYRITPKGQNPGTPALNPKTVEGQVAALRSPANNVRNIGFTRLKAAGESSVPAVEELLDDPNPYLRARAIWLLAQLGEKGIALVEKTLKQSDDPQVRVACFRALRFVESNTMRHARALADDPSPAVRREVALALRDRPLKESLDLIIELARQYRGEDRWYLEALGTASVGKETPVYRKLLEEIGREDPLQWSEAFAKLAWRLHPPSAFPAFKKRALSLELLLEARKEALTALGFMPTKGAAMAMVLIAEKGPEDTRQLAQWWLHNRSSHSWSEWADQMKGLNKKPNELKPDKDYVAPIDGPPITKLSVADVLSLEGDPEKGKAHIARCYMCHQVNGTGIDFGPALDQWGQGQSAEAIATAIIDPNAGIAHGFEATEIVTKDGHRIQGFSLFAGGSHILKVMGGGEVSISRRDIRSAETMDKSLMMSAGQLGLQPQEVADIVAFLKRSGTAGKSRAAFPATGKEAVPKKKGNPFQDPFANPNDDPDLPRVLLIGDSISIGYTPRVRSLLKGKAHVHRPETNCRWSAFGNEMIEAWIGDSEWDVIHFNFGLWDWYGWAQETRSTPESYARNLENIVAKLKAKTDAPLVFATTTPPCVGPERKVKFVVSQDRAKEFNKVAGAVMKKHGVQINDLYSVIGEDRTRYQRGANDVHYIDAGRDLLAAKVAETIATALPAVRREANSENQTNKKKILFIAGNTKHRHGVHEYRAGSILLANALNESGLPLDAKVHWYGWPEDESIFDGVDACVLYADAGGELGEKYAFLDERVKDGMGIMFMHYGVHPTKEVGERYYKKWIGGYYDDDFSVNPSWIAELVPKRDHSVARGLQSTLKVYDELYWNLNLDTENSQVYALATAIPTRQNMVRYGSSKFWNRLAADKLGTKQELLWCHDPETGARGAGFVGGHYHCNWAIDDYRKLILNTIAWVARVEVPADGVPSKTVTKAMLNENLNRPDFPEEVELPTADLLTQLPGKYPELGPDGRMPPRKPRKPAAAK